MMYLSFAWTTEAWLKGLKTATRRFWTDEYAEKFWRSALASNYKAIACNRQLRFGGAKIGLVRLVQRPFKQNLKYSTAQDEIEEGHLWGAPEKYVEMMLSQGKGDTPWVVRFDAFDLNGRLIAKADRNYLTMKPPVTKL